jgi:hypothetical protein
MEVAMTLAEEKQIKNLFKQAMLELMTERRDELYDLFAEALEDTLLVKAIRAGENSPTVDKADILRVLDGAA